MKCSKYNTVTHYAPDNVHIFYNSLSGGLFVLDNSTNEFARAILDSPNVTPDGPAEEVEKIRKTLTDGRFIIDDDVDELNVLKVRNSMSRFGSRVLGLVIAPTLNCNFDCPYCYVDRDKVAMNSDTIARVKKFFTQKAEQSIEVQVCWTGGEPLLALDVIEELTDYFIAETKRLKKKYSASLISNGYLLSPDAVRRLKSIDISSIQITLDGSESNHDKFRFTRGNQGSYQRIFENIVAASHNDMKISLRSNLDKVNIASVYALVDDLAASDVKKNNLLFCPCKIVDYEHCASACENPFFTTEEFSHIEPALLFYGLKKGVKSHLQQFKARSTFCGANTSSLFVIDAHANLLKCWCNLGNSERNKIGRIGESGETVIENHHNVVKWLSADPFDSEECRNCNVLPTCLGGCFYHDIFGKTKNDAARCSSRRFNLEKMLQLYYINEVHGGALNDIHFN